MVLMKRDWQNKEARSIETRRISHEKDAFHLSSNAEAWRQAGGKLIVK